MQVHTSFSSVTSGAVTGSHSSILNVSTEGVLIYGRSQLLAYNKSFLVFESREDSLMRRSSCWQGLNSGISHLLSFKSEYLRRKSKF